MSAPFATPSHEWRAELCDAGVGGGPAMPRSSALHGKAGTRRAFLRALGVTVVAVVTGEWWSARRAPARSPVSPVRIDGAMTLAAGDALSFHVPDTGIDGILVRLASGELTAFDRRCPHLGCPVLWSAMRGQFECPCHAAAFDAQGAVISGPPRHGLRRFEVAVRGEAVWISGEVSGARDLPLTPSLERRGDRREARKERKACET